MPSAMLSASGRCVTGFAGICWSKDATSAGWSPRIMSIPTRAFGSLVSRPFWMRWVASATCFGSGLASRAPTSSRMRGVASSRAAISLEALPSRR